MSDTKHGILRSVGLKYISPMDIERNKQNPRILFDEDTMSILRESIKKVGILVPLSVYQIKGQERYVILDGERRWRCALDLNLKQVPANIIAEPDLITNILTMFNIHNVRENWDVTSTALKLEVVMRLAKTRNDKELSTLTGMSTARIHDCKKLLNFDRKYLDMTILGNKEERIGGDFFVQLYPVLKHLKKDFPEIYERYGKNGITDIMIEKYKMGAISGVLEFRLLLRTIMSVEKGKSREAISRAVTNVIEKREATLQSAYDSIAKNVYESEKLAKSALRLKSALQTLELDSLSVESDLKPILLELRDEINRILRELRSS